jgi:hypothetical protein
VRLLRTTLLLTVLVFALAAAGCGSDEAEVPEVPGPPATLAVPHQKGAEDLSEDAEETPTPTPTAEGEEGAEGEATPAPADSGSTETGGTDAAATPAPATEDSPTNDTAPEQGSAPEQFEQFCEENAGAC